MLIHEPILEHMINLSRVTSRMFFVVTNFQMNLYDSLGMWAELSGRKNFWLDLNIVCRFLKILFVFVSF